MTALSIQPTFPTFTGADGQPLENGYIWVGTANLNPITNPITVYWDAALSAPATQPIRTLGGYPSNSGTPARLYVNSDYSIQVLDRKGSVVYSAPVATDRYGGGIINANIVVYDPSGTGAVATTVQGKLRESVSVKDFGAVGDGVTDDTAAIQAAIDAVSTAGGGTVLISGTSSVYALATAPVIVKSNVHVIFEGWLKLIAPSAGGGIMGTEEGSVNCYIQNVKIDGNNIYSGGSGENGFGFGGTKHKMFGGTIKNCAKGYGNSISTTGDGGKGIQNETEYGDIVVDGVTFENCFMAISTRQEHIAHAYECGPQIFSNITATNCNILFFVEYAGVGSIPDGQKHSVILNGFSAKDCGDVSEGVLQFSNAGNVLVSNGLVTNSGFTTPAFIRGRHRYCSFKGIQFAGNCTSVISNTPGTYCALTAPSEQNYYELQHIGALANLLGSSAASDKAITNSTLLARIDTDPSSGLIDVHVPDVSTHCVIVYDGKVLRGSSTFISAYYGLFASVGWAGDVLGNCEEGAWTPTITSSGGTITTVTDVIGLYRKVGREVSLFLKFTISDNGTGSGGFRITTSGLPASITPPVQGTTGTFTENNAAGIFGYIYNPGSGGNPLLAAKYDNSYPGVTNGKYSCVVRYTVAT